MQTSMRSKNYTLRGSNIMLTHDYIDKMSNSI